MESESKFKIFLINCARKLDQQAENFIKFVNDYYQRRDKNIYFSNSSDILDVLGELEENNLFSATNTEILYSFFIHIRRTDLQQDLNSFVLSQSSSINENTLEYNKLMESPLDLSNTAHSNSRNNFNIDSHSRANRFIQNLLYKLRQDEKDYFRQYLDWYIKSYDIQFHSAYYIANTDFKYLLDELLEKQIIQDNDYRLIYSYFTQIRRNDLEEELSDAVKHNSASQNSSKNKHVDTTSIVHRIPNKQEPNNYMSSVYNTDREREFIRMESMPITDKQIVLWVDLINPNDWKPLSVLGLRLPLASVTRIDYDYRMSRDKVNAMFHEWRHLSYYRSDSPPFTESGFKQALKEAQLNDIITMI